MTNFRTRRNPKPLEIVHIKDRLAEAAALEKWMDPVYDPFAMYSKEVADANLQAAKTVDRLLDHEITAVHGKINPDYDGMSVHTGMTLAILNLAQIVYELTDERDTEKMREVMSGIDAMMELYK